MSLESFKQGIANDLRNALLDSVPVDTGRLKGSIKVQIKDDEIVIEMNDYGLYVEYGTPPHIIRPKNKNSLKWKSGDKTYFAKVVQHPGTRPNPFIRTTFKQDLVEIVENNAILHLSDGDEVEVEV